MKPGKALILLILVLVTAALLGLVSVQLFFLNQSYDLKRQAFHQNVEKVLASIVAKLETQETLTRVSRLTLEVWKDGETEIARLNARDTNAIKAPAGLIPNKSSRFYTPVEPRGETAILHLRRDQRVRLIDLAEEADIGFRFPPKSVRKDDLTKGALLLDAVKPAGTHVLSLPNIKSTPFRYYRLLLDDISHGITAKNGRVESVIFIPTLDQARTAIVDRVLEQHLAYEQIPILDRIDTPTLDRTIRETLLESGIGLDYAFAIISSDGSSPVCTNNWCPGVPSRCSQVFFPISIDEGPGFPSGISVKSSTSSKLKWLARSVYFPAK